MATKCKHGVDESFCATCREAAETRPLGPESLVITSDGNPAILLRTNSNKGNASALVLEAGMGRLTTVGLGGLQPVDSSAGLITEPRLLARFHEVALKMGFLFHPERELTAREQSDEGPSHCYHCRTILSLKGRSLGCTQCQYYVCLCGRCLCGYTGKNYLGQVFSQYPELPIPRSQRLEFVRIVRFSTHYV